MRITLKCTLRSSVGLALAVASAPLNAIAQTEEADAAIVLDSVMVTAQRRAEDAQDVPISMSVFNAKALEDGGVTRIEDFAGQAPNVHINFNSSIRATAISIRGIISDPNSVGIDPAVGVYVDGVYMARPTTVNAGLFDLERVEVLRGPQGTLFGQNTIAGVLSFVSRAPTDQNEFSLSAGMGNYNSRSLTAVGNIPLVQGVLAARGAFQLQQRDGFLRNLAGPDNNDADNINGRIAVSYTPADSISVVLRADSARDRTRLGGVEVYRPSPMFEAAPFNTPQDLDPWDRVISDSPSSFQDRDVSGTSLEVNWNIGSGTLTSITAYRAYEWNNFQTTDKSPFDMFGTGIKEDQDQFSQEIRYAGQAGDSFHYVAGAFYLKQDMDAEAYANVGADVYAPFGFPLGSNPATGKGYIDIATGAESIAAFGQVDWMLTDALQATVGLRYTSEDKSIVHELFGDPTGLFVPTVPQVRFSRTDNEPSWRAGLQYYHNDNFMSYATYSRGFKAGGYNAFAFGLVQPDGTPADFEPETVDNYEVGFKSTLANGRVRLNAAAFYLDYQDLQVNQLLENAQGIISYQTSNAATAESKGIEIDLTARLSRGIDISLAYGYADATFQSFPGATPAGDDYSGNRLPESPHNTFSATAQYQRPIMDGWDLFAHGEFTHRDGLYSDSANTPLLEVGAVDLVNGRVGLSRSDGRFGVYLWGRNLFNTDYADSRFAGSGAFAPGAVFQYIGAPRTYGVELNYRWGDN